MHDIGPIRRAVSVAHGPERGVPGCKRPAHVQFRRAVRRWAVLSLLAVCGEVLRQWLVGRGHGRKSMYHIGQNLQR